MELIVMLKSGGITLGVLLLCSILSITIIIERLVYFKARTKVGRADFMAHVTAEVRAGNMERALKICKNTNAPFAQVAHTGLKLFGKPESAVTGAMQREITLETHKLERRTSITGTIGSVAVYIGLFGTVLGIIRAFQDISASGSSGLNIVINGIAEALICTAAGLAVAVPAVIFYNYFVKKIDAFVMDMELCASEVLDLAKEKQA